MKKHIFILGSRGYNFKYGGWETFVYEFVNNYKDKDTKFYIPYLTFNKEEDFSEVTEKNINSINLYVPQRGFATMFNFTRKSFKYTINYLTNNKLSNVYVIVLGCKMGPFMKGYYKKLKALGAKVLMNPDGLEWKREKWPWWIKQCVKISENYHVKYTDKVICDSKAIKKYIDDKYLISKKTDFIPYGAYLDDSIKDKNKCKKFFSDNNLEENNYYLVVGRFVPENNLELIIREYKKSKSEKPLVIITNYSVNKFYNHLVKTTDFINDERIRLIGSVYDKDIIKYLRLNAYAYIHGHKAGGTNPSLLESLALTKLNIVFNVSYNKEVGEESCFYFDYQNSLSNIIRECDNLKQKEIDEYGKKCKKRIIENYTWDIIVDKYNEVFKELK